MRKRISKRSKTLAAGLVLYGFMESPYIMNKNSLGAKYYTFFNFIDGTSLYVISVVINKSKAKYRVRSNRANIRENFKPITKTTLHKLIGYLKTTDLNYAINNSKEPEDY